MSFCCCLIWCSILDRYSSAVLTSWLWHKLPWWALSVNSFRHVNHLALEPEENLPLHHGRNDIYKWHRVWLNVNKIHLLHNWFPSLMQDFFTQKILYPRIFFKLKILVNWEGIYCIFNLKFCCTGHWVWGFPKAMRSLQANPGVCSTVPIRC